MTASPQFGRRLTYKREECRLLHKMVRQAAQSVPDPQTSVNFPLTPAEIVAQWDAEGMGESWAARTDIGGSAAYARTLREQAQRRETSR